jgi:hypothetical protein
VHRSTEAVRFLACEHLDDVALFVGLLAGALIQWAPARDGDLALRGLPQRCGACAFENEQQSRLAFNHNVADVGPSRANDGYARHGYRQFAYPLCPGAGLPGTTATLQQPNEPVRAGWRPLVTASVRVVVLVVGFAVACTASAAVPCVLLLLGKLKRVEELLLGSLVPVFPRLSVYSRGCLQCIIRGGYMSLRICHKP